MISPLISTVFADLTIEDLSVARPTIRGMGHSTREEIVEAFDNADQARDRMSALTFDTLTTPELLRAMERELRNERRSRARLRITKAHAGRWIAEAHDLGHRHTPAGAPLPPILTETATAQHHGDIDDAHISVIRSFLAHLPTHIDAGTREQCEADLARQSRGFRPEQVTTYAHKLMDYLNQDGDCPDEDTARSRGLTLSPQHYDGMTRLTGLITAELHAAIEALLATLAAPGTANPETDGSDTRSTPQRDHDALLHGITTLFKTGALGHHNTPARHHHHHRRHHRHRNAPAAP